MVANISAITIEYQMPSRSKKMGSIITASDWNTRVRKKDIIAEIMPLLRAVKNPDPQIAIPEKRKEKEKI